MTDRAQSTRDARWFQIASLAAFIALVAPAIAIPGVAEAQRGVNGYNVQSVSVAGGRFVSNGNSRWIEYGRRGEARFYFTETQRDQWSVYLVDRSRNVRIQIDIHRRMVRYAEGGNAWADLYRITHAS